MEEKYRINQIQNIKLYQPSISVVGFLLPKVRTNEREQLHIKTAHPLRKPDERGCLPAYRREQPDLMPVPKVLLLTGIQTVYKPPRKDKKGWSSFS